jgi:hypothetical protein
LDVACRRIAWDAAAIWAWSTNRVGMLLGSLRPREVESQATLAALKLSRSQADSNTPRPAQPADDTLTPTPSKKHKFEAAKDFQAQDNFTQAVGGAGESNASPSTKPTDSTDTPTEQGPTTSRLLAAKRRARENRGNKE